MNDIYWNICYWLTWIYNIIITFYFFSTVLQKSVLRNSKLSTYHSWIIVTVIKYIIYLNQYKNVVFIVTITNNKNSDKSQHIYIYIYLGLCIKYKINIKIIKFQNFKN